MPTFISKWIYPVIVVLVGLISVGLSEMVMHTWLSNVGFDATGAFFWKAVIPVQLVVVGITTVLLALIYRSRYRIFLPLYALVYIGAHCMELNSFGNPPMDILQYVLAIVIACAVWFTVLWQLLLKGR